MAIGFVEKASSSAPDVAEPHTGSGWSRRRKVVIASGVGICVAVLAFGITRPQHVFAAADEVGIQYGSSDDPAYLGVVAPGDSIATGSALDQMLHGSDSFYFYPTAQQTYLVGEAEGADAAPIIVVSKDGVRVEMSGQLYFALNNDPDFLRTYHEQFGLASGAYIGQPEWDAMVDTYVRPQLDRALDLVTLEYDWMQLRSDPALRQEFEAAVGAKTQALLTQAMGGSYFCGSASQECSALTFGLERLKPMDEELSTVTEDQARQTAELQGVQRQIDLLGIDGYLAKLQNDTLQKAIDSGKVSVYVVPQGTSVPLPAGAQPTS